MGMVSSLRWLDARGIARLEAGGTNCYRIAAGPDAFVDWWDGRVVISAKSEEEASGIFRQMECGPLDFERVRAVYRRILKPNPGPQDRTACLQGSPLDGEFSAMESGLLYAVNLCDGYSAGLFPDQRENRLTLQELIAQRPQPPRILNLFSYTCAFSVAAAKAGAMTTSVDLSRRYLEIGRTNFERNALSPADHKFVAEDAIRFLPRLERRREKFDFIILDPPTFGRGSGGRVFRLERDFPDLLGMALACAAPGAVLLLSGNRKNLSQPVFRDWASRIAPHARLIPGKVPEDYLGSPCSSTCWLHLP
jgi:23S rRNA (cytosine1962-C5)-methyltransferase